VSGRYQPYGYTYTVGPRVSSVRPVRTSRTEILHILLASLVLTLDFVLVYGGPAIYSFQVEFSIIASAAAAAVSAFVAHELAHKFSAQRRGYWAEFRLSPVGLFLSIVIAFAARLLWAAPGATMIGGMSTPEDWGRTSLAGPTTNFVFGLLFLGSSFVVGAYYPSETLFSGSLLFLAYINSWFGAFNMIPVGPLDGAKVWRWSKSTWVICFVVFGGLAAYLFYLVFILLL
jgi:Zn-dependent protease